MPAAGNLPPPTAYVTLLAIPVVALSTHAVRRWPPSIAPATIRRVVALLLAASGLAIAAPALWHLLGL